MSDISITLGAGGQQEIKTTANYWYVYSTSLGNAITLRFNSGESVSRLPSQGGEIPNGATSVIVSSATAQTIILSFSDTPLQNDVVEVSNTISATIAPGNTLDNGGDVSLTALSATLVRAADADGLTVILKADIANTVTIRIGTTGVAATQGYPLEPGESISLSTIAAIAAYNPHATVAQNIHVLPVRTV